MAFKVAALLAFCAVASGQVILRPSPYARPLPIGRAQLAYAQAPVALAQAPLGLRREDAEYDPNPQYDYSYSVDDATTGDSKTAHETRNGDNVQGSYSLIEPDGSRRIVEYSADPVNGFNAVVHKEGGVAGPAAVARAPVAVAPSPITYARTAPIIAPRPVLAPQQIYAPQPILRAGSPALVSSSFSSPYAQYAL